MGILAAIMQIIDITNMEKATPETVIAFAVLKAEKEEAVHSTMRSTRTVIEHSKGKTSNVK